MPGNVYVCGFCYNLNSLGGSVSSDFLFGGDKSQNMFVMYCIRFMQDKFR